MQLPFDRVRIEADGVRHWLSGPEFMALPLHERLAALFENRVEFYDGETSLEPHHALRVMRESA